MKYWQIIADNLSKAGWSWDGVSALDYERRTLWIVDAHRDDGKRFDVRADGKAGCVSGIGIGGSRISVRDRANGLMAFGSAYRSVPWGLF